ncbi:MAG: hypothetical protein CML20_00745 [Rheinheimera sp.]|uniref:hypothetical protein n=1 Tax=Arsukibacterium sp. UBA3155 TaxID=1946058 RepID=UPI000C9512B8|nr:hypothetical protein [Arsukibacterium sp. UBA3155]MAD73328.1 hypothetical protein [Rheinheimera sp.]|tara:strand:+ start:167445 stop:167657 length:213 start_codon:yes stop_codon:yes gene_type:complete
MDLESNNNDYFKQLSKELERQYCISFNDTGYTEYEWLDRFGDMPLDEAVSAYAQKYDLTSLKDVAPMVKY